MSDYDSLLEPRMRSFNSVEDSADQLAVLPRVDKGTTPNRHLPRAPDVLRSFPPEILCMIFGHCVDSYTGSERGDALADSFVRPFQCAAVCSRWRAVALAMPSLWTHITVRSFRSRFWAGHFRWLTELALARSGSCSLVIAFEWYHKEAASEYMAILGMLVQHCSRWRKLSIFIKGDTQVGEDICCTFFDERLNFLAQPTPRLEELYLHFPTITTECGLANTPDFLPHAPRLHTAHLANVPIDFILCTSRFNGVETLTWGDTLYLLLRFYSMTSCFPFITTLKICWRRVAVDTVNDDPVTVVLPQLTALLIENPISVSREDAPDLYDESVDRIMGDSRTWGRPSPILRGIVAPKLRNLTAHAECLPSLASFLSRVSDTLEFIDVSGLRNASPLDSAAARALRSATQLRRLRLAHCELTRGFLRKLRAAAGDIWPRLQDMTLNSVRYDDERLLRFFEKRYPSHDAVHVEIPVPVVVVRFVGAEMRDSPTAIAVSSLLDDERRRRSLPDVGRPVRVTDNIDSLG